MVAVDPFTIDGQKAKFDMPAIMRWVALQHGKGIPRQFAEMAMLALPPFRLKPIDYFQYALFRRDFSAADRRLFLSDATGGILHKRLSSQSHHQRALLVNKALTSHVLQSAGFPIIPIIAYFSSAGTRIGRRNLATVAELAAYLRSEAPLPLFCKPVDGSIGVGGASLVSREADGTILLGNGIRISAEALAEAIGARFPQGYIFQPLIQPHPDTAALTGPTTGILRVVTLWEESGPELLYTVQKLPSPGAMIDSSENSLDSAYAAVDPTTGTILRAQSRANLNTKAKETAPVTGAPLVGHVLPHVAASVALAKEAHRLFPGHGILGFDIPATVDGPVILEINSNPYHLLYQRANDKPLLKGQTGARIKAVQVAMAARERR